MHKINLAISRLRKEQEVTQRELADHLGVTFQSVSKWENGTTMPDISLLPALSAYFKVSVDHILGLEHNYNSDYIDRKTDSAHHWNDKVKELISSRNHFWNDDYFKFLVQNVWNINRPINVVDYGCGYGYLGDKLLSILPKGSTYTGIDISKELLQHGKAYLSHFGDAVQFVESDVLMVKASAQYDLAICQALLRHTPHPKQILKHMKDAVKTDGLIVCIEVNRALESVGSMISGLPYQPWDDIKHFSKLWESEHDNEGRDFAAGFRIPFDMQSIGLRKIDVRLNDKVNFVSSVEEDAIVKVEEICNLNGWKALSEADEEKVDLLLENRGYTLTEIRKFKDSKERIHRFINDSRGKTSIINMIGTVISYGYK